MVALSGSKIKQTSKQQQDASNFSATSSNLIPQQIKGEMAKKAEAKLEESVSNMVDVSAKLEQDQMEGVDEKEWVGILICWRVSVKREAQLIYSSYLAYVDVSTQNFHYIFPDLWPEPDL